MAIISKLPGSSEIEWLWDRYEVTEPVRRHCRVVARNALQLSRWLREVEIPIDLATVEAGALLHDIAKLREVESKLPHDREGERLLRQHGYPELGRLVGLHVTLPPNHPLDEAMIVYYSDKRVKHDQVVDLAQRFDDLRQRYAHLDAAIRRRIEDNSRRVQQAELTLFSPLRPRYLPEHLT